MNTVSKCWLLLCLVLYFFCIPKTEAQTATVRGFVTDASDGQALQGVNVALRDVTGNLRGDIADDDGFFIVVRLQPGRWFLRASFIGYETFHRYA